MDQSIQTTKKRHKAISHNHKSKSVTPEKRHQCVNISESKELVVVATFVVKPRAHTHT